MSTRIGFASTVEDHDAGRCSRDHSQEVATTPFLGADGRTHLAYIRRASGLIRAQSLYVSLCVVPPSSVRGVSQILNHFTHWGGHMRLGGRPCLLTSGRTLLRYVCRTLSPSSRRRAQPVARTDFSVSLRAGRSLRQGGRSTLEITVMSRGRSRAANKLKAAEKACATSHQPLGHQRLTPGV